MNQFLSPPSSDFAAVRDGRRSMPLWLDIDLTTARSIAAGTAQVLNIAGNSLYSDQNLIQGVATVHFQDTALGNTSAPITVNPGFIAGVPFTQLLIENAAQPGYRMRIFYGVDIDFTPGTGGLVNVTGTVSVVDGAKVRTAANKAFWGSAGVAALAGNYSSVQLWNPAGSGKTLCVEQISFGTFGVGTPVTYYLGATNVAQTAYTNGRSKQIGGALSTAEIRTGQNAALPTTYTLMPLYAPSGNQTITLKLSEPILLPPGYGLVISGGVNVAVQGDFEFYEE